MTSLKTRFNSTNLKIKLLLEVYSRKIGISSKKLLILLCALILAIVFLIYSNFIRLKKTEKDIHQNSISSEVLQSECQTDVNTSQKDFEFVAEHKIDSQAEIDKINFKFGEVEYFKNRFEIDDNILEFYYLENKNKIVYLTGEDYFENADHVREVKIFDPKEGTTNTIFSYQTVFKESENSLVLDVSVIRSISINKNQDKVAIITDKEIFIYDLNSNQFTIAHDGDSSEVYYRDTINNRHFFNSLTFSPDDKYAVLSYGYYEGISYYLLNLETKIISSLNKGGYGDGSFVRGWLDENILYTEIDGVDRSLCIQSVNLNTPECINMIIGSEAYDVENINNEVYMLSDRRDLIKTFAACNNIGNIYQFSPKYDSILKYSFTTNTEQEILHKDTTEVSGFKLKSKILAFTEYNLNEKQGLLVKVKLEDENIAYGYLDPNVPEKLTSVILAK